MNNLEHMVEQHVREYESRLRHVDELVERAQASERPDPDHALQGLVSQRNDLADQLEQMRQKSFEHWREDEIERAGPMAVWDALAQQLEDLVERFERP